MEILKNKRYVGIAGLVLLALGTFLPMMTVSVFGISESISVNGYWEGYVIYGCAILAATIMFEDLIKKTNLNIRLVSGKLGQKLILLPVIITVLVMIKLMADVSEVTNLSKYAHYGVGFYMIWLGAAALAVHVFTYKPATSGNIPAAGSIASATPAAPAAPTAPETPQTTDQPTPPVQPQQ